MEESQDSGCGSGNDTQVRNPKHTHKQTNTNTHASKQLRGVGAGDATACKKDAGEVSGTDGASEEVILAVDEREPCFAPALQCRSSAAQPDLLNSRASKIYNQNRTRSSRDANCKYNDDRKHCFASNSQCPCEHPAVLQDGSRTLGD